VGRFSDGRRLLAGLWTSRAQHSDPLQFGEVLIALAHCAMAAGEHAEAKMMLDDTVATTRHVPTAVPLYHALSVLHGVPEAQGQQWRANEIVRRMAMRDVIDSEERTARAVAAEFERLGMT
jgi:hypothetical protein